MITPKKENRRSRRAPAVAEALECRQLLATYPASTISAPAVAASAFNYDFSVTYTSSLKVRRSSIDRYDIAVAGPHGFSQFARLLSVDKSNDSPQLIAKYRFSAPYGLWDYPDNGTYSITLRKGQVRDAQNNPVRQKLLKSLTVNLGAALTYPVATLQEAPRIDRWSGTYVFKVSYASSFGVTSSTVDGRDISITGPNGFSQTARLHAIIPTGDARLLVARYKITAPAGYWNAAANGVYTISVNGGQVRDTLNNPTRQRVIGSMTVGVPEFPTDVGQVRPLPPIVVDATTFGATPNDGTDDTNAIQAAIDSVPQAQGVPSVLLPIGAFVTLPGGVFTLSRPLKMTASVWLRGSGTQTVLNNVSSDPNSAAIFLYSPFGHGYCINVQVQNLKIQTAAAKGVQADPALPGDLVDLRLDGVTISSGGTAIDLSGVDVYQSTINNVTIQNPGGAALWLRVSRRNSALNRVTGLTVSGTARNGFNNSLPLITLGGDVTVADVDIKDIAARLVPLSLVNMFGSIRGVSIATLAANLQSTQLARIDSSFVRIDALDGLSSTRRLTLVNSRETNVQHLGVASGSTLASSVSVDAASHLTVEHVHSAGGVGPIEPSRVVVHGLTSGGIIPTGPLDTSRELAPASALVVDVTAFGAVANDEIDDTTAIQSAIDSLPKGNGIPSATQAVGGMVVFPIGVFNTNAPVRVPSGVWLSGQAYGTLIRNGSNDASSAAIELVSSAGGLNVGAGVTNLAINTTVARGIGADSGISNGLVDPRIFNIDVSSGGVAVDLRNVKTYHARFESVLVTNPGSSAMWLGDDAGYSSGNVVIGLQLVGGIRSGYRLDTAQLVVRGQVTLESCWLEAAGSNDLPLQASGAVTIRGLWAEYHPQNLPNSILASFDDCYLVDVDRFVLVDDQHKLRFRNSTGVTIGNLDIAGTSTTLAHALDLDAVSKLSISTVNANIDAGMLDDPRTKIGGVYNQAGARYAETNRALTGTNLVTDPNFNDVGNGTGSHAWQVFMGDSLGDVQGSFAVEQTAGGPRLRVTITGNPNNRPVSIQPRLSIPAGAVGKSLMARWRVDGPPGTTIWGERFEYNYVTNVAGSMTAVVSPRAAAADTALTILLPATIGTYYVSKVGLVVNG